MVGERKQVTVLFADRDDLVLSCYLSRDFHEGVRAFLEKHTRTGRAADRPYPCFGCFGR